MVLLESEKIKMGTAAPDFQNLPGIDGNNHSLSDFKDKKVLIVIFMCNHCPYVQAIFDRLIALQADYQDKGVQIIGINPNDAKQYPEDSMEGMMKEAETRAINFVYVRDDSQEIAHAYNAQCTPDIFVYGEGAHGATAQQDEESGSASSELQRAYKKDRKLIYHGRVDDNWKDESQVTKQELREALDLYLESGELVEDQHPSMGCSIKWLV